MLAASIELVDAVVEQVVASTIVDSPREEEAMAGCDFDRVWLAWKVGSDVQVAATNLDQVHPPQ